MAFINSRENMMSHESEEYINSRPDWVIGKIPDLSDYLKLSVGSFEEAFTLAKFGQQVVSAAFPSYKGEPMRLYFTQALLIGAGLLDREQAQKLGLDFERYRSVLMVTPSRYGKLIEHNTPVITTKGWKKHGELVPGEDYVFHPSGRPIKVLATKPGKTTHRVHFQNGEVIECHANHEWRVWDRNASNGKNKSHGKYAVYETWELINMGVVEYGEKQRPKFLVDSPQQLQFETQHQVVDPYFLGCWLGDETNNKPVLTLSKEKQMAILPNIPYTPTHIRPQIGCDCIEFTHQFLRTQLGIIGVLGNKHIPGEYKYASIQQQKSILAGIIDTDGSVDKNGRVTIVSASERLKDDILELLTIMGQCPYYTEVEPTTSSSGIVGKSKVYYIGFMPSIDLPTKYKKLTRIKPHRRIGITNIEPVENGEEGNCIQVDSPDGLYLVGKSCIPTHNSYLNAILVICQAALKGLEVRIGGATMDKAAIVQGKVTELLPYTSRAIQEGLVVVSGKDNVTRKIQRMSTQVSKDSLKWRNGGSIMMFATNEAKKNADVQAAGAVGIGGDFQVHDEIQLMSPSGFRTASRFLMENANTKRFCVGNPSINGHFKDLYDDPNTFVVHMNDITAIVEQRMTRQGFNLTGMPTYSPEYRSYILCQFPDGQSNSRFFSTLPSESHSEQLEKPKRKKYYLGIDSAYNGADSLMVTIVSVNYTSDGQLYIVCEKQEDLKKKYPEWKKGTTTHIALDILKMWENYEIQYGAIDIGQGIHIYEEIFRLNDGINLEPINFGSKPTEWRTEIAYSAQNASNKRAEMHLDLKDICEKKLLYIDTSCYEDIVRQMRELNTGTATAGGKIRIEPKENLKRRIGRSPDNLDSLCLAIHAVAISGGLDGCASDEDDEVFMEVI